MASLAAIEPGLNPGTLPKEESVVPVSIFAPDCGDDLSGAECFEDGENVNGESEDHLDFTSKVGPALDSAKARYMAYACVDFNYTSALTKICCYFFKLK
jgi:hypothetical protein